MSRRQMHSLFKLIDSPIGTLQLVAQNAHLAAIMWVPDRPNRVQLGVLEERPSEPVLCEAEAQLAQYFSGQRTRFNIPLIFNGTPFQKSVWSALLTIPFGETRTYSEIATQVGRPTAVRAVGAANGRNPIAIIAPCHRVIGASGELTGFAGGLDVKEQLLSLEGRLPAIQTTSSHRRFSGRRPLTQESLFKEA